MIHTVSSRSSSVFISFKVPEPKAPCRSPWTMIQHHPCIRGEKVNIFIYYDFVCIKNGRSSGRMVSLNPHCHRFKFRTAQGNFCAPAFGAPPAGARFFCAPRPVRPRAPAHPGRVTPLLNLLRVALDRSTCGQLAHLRAKVCFPAQARPRHCGPDTNS
jgi:hypothetical protein